MWTKLLEDDPRELRMGKKVVSRFHQRCQRCYAGIVPGMKVVYGRMIATHQVGGVSEEKKKFGWCCRRCTDSDGSDLILPHWTPLRAVDDREGRVGELSLTEFHHVCLRCTSDLQPESEVVYGKIVGTHQIDGASLVQKKFGWCCLGCTDYDGFERQVLSVEDSVLPLADAPPAEFMNLHSLEEALLEAELQEGEYWSCDEASDDEPEPEVPRSSGSGGHPRVRSMLMRVVSWFMPLMTLFMLAGCNLEGNVTRSTSRREDWPAAVAVFDYMAFNRVEGPSGRSENSVVIQLAEMEGQFVYIVPESVALCPNDLVSVPAHFFEHGCLRNEAERMIMVEFRLSNTKVVGRGSGGRTNAAGSYHVFSIGNVYVPSVDGCLKAMPSLNKGPVESDVEGGLDDDETPSGAPANQVRGPEDSLPAIEKLLKQMSSSFEARFATIESNLDRSVRDLADKASEDIAGRFAGFESRMAQGMTQGSGAPFEKVSAPLFTAGELDGKMEPVKFPDLGIPPPPRVIDEISRRSGGSSSGILKCGSMSQKESTRSGPVVFDLSEQDRATEQPRAQSADAGGLAQLGKMLEAMTDAFAAMGEKPTGDGVAAASGVNKYAKIEEGLRGDDDVALKNYMGFKSKCERLLCGEVNSSKSWRYRDIAKFVPLGGGALVKRMLIAELDTLELLEQVMKKSTIARVGSYAMLLSRCVQKCRWLILHVVNPNQGSQAWRIMFEPDVVGVPSGDANVGSEHVFELNDQSQLQAVLGYTKAVTSFTEKWKKDTDATPKEPWWKKREREQKEKDDKEKDKKSTAGAGAGAAP